MCYASSCNPTCGKCRPRRAIVVRCPECSASIEISREQFLLITGLPHRQNIVEKKMIERGAALPDACSHCGADLTAAIRAAVEPLPCARSRIICGFPCGMHTDAFDAAAARCDSMVPLGAFGGEEVPPSQRPWQR